MENNLVNPTDKEVFIFDLELHILTLYGVLLIMFFLIISPTSRKQLNNTVNRPIQKLNTKYGTKDESILDRINLASKTPGGANCTVETDCNFYIALHQTNSQKTLGKLRDYYKNSTTDLQKDSYNSALTVSSIIIFLILFIFILFSYYSLRYTARRKINIKNLIISNILLFLMIGCIEVLFFYNITLNYSPLLPSELTENLVKDLKEKL